MLEKIVRWYGLQKSEHALGEGKTMFRVVWGLDLEGVVAKRIGDTYSPKTKWFKSLNPDYSQKVDRTELFERRHDSTSVA
jgi:ATP-dependent DNA ligase